MCFLKENYNDNNIIYKSLDLDEAYIIVIFNLFFYFFEFKIAISVDWESLFIVIIIIGIYGT